jgi:hypothetical protein
MPRDDSDLLARFWTFKVFAAVLVLFTEIPLSRAQYVRVSRVETISDLRQQERDNFETMLEPYSAVGLFSGTKSQEIELTVSSLRKQFRRAQIGIENTDKPGVKAVVFETRSPFDTYSAVQMLTSSNAFFKVGFACFDCGAGPPMPAVTYKVSPSFFFAAPTQPDLAEATRKLESLCTDFLAPYNDSKKVVFAPDENFSFTAKVSGLKGAIIKGSGYWEDLDIYVNMARSIQTSDIVLKIQCDASSGPSPFGSKPNEKRMIKVAEEHPKEMSDFMNRLNEFMWNRAQAVVKIKEY